MRKTVYLLGLTLLCGFQAQAQETSVAADLAATVRENTAQPNAQTDNLIQSQEAPAEILQIEEQTIFFNDEQPDEPDWGAAPVIPVAPKVPTVQIPDDVKAPEIKQLPTPVVSNEVENLDETSAEAENKSLVSESNDSSDTQEKVEKKMETITPSPVLQEQPTVIPTGAQPVPQEVVPASQTENTVKEEVSVIEISTEKTTQIIAEEAPNETENDAPKIEVQPEPAVEETTQENLDIPAVVSQTTETSEPAPKKNSFSLDENALLQSQANSYSLDTNAALSDSFLKNDALSPTVLNRSIINISPEQRAKMMMKKKYDEMDANQDGMVSESEFVEYKTKEARKIAQQVFKQIDRNDNKLLSQYEYGLLMDKMIENYIKPQTTK